MQHEKASKKLRFKNFPKSIMAKCSSEKDIGKGKVELEELEVLELAPSSASRGFQETYHEAAL